VRADKRRSVPTLEALRREIQESLNVIETWNRANSFILYGKGGEIAT
jgi:TnpA family transposase